MISITEHHQCFDSGPESAQPQIEAGPLAEAQSQLERRSTSCIGDSLLELNTPSDLQMQGVHCENGTASNMGQQYNGSIRQTEP